ncbi:UDP-4-amino-4,6-dideoxy-N-acetyl-beta-L-altrosamine N-acetyltransferase [Ketobacter alkanivorans]|uniref:UDP-4-amino-4, 6-dideoxy-N-acetyl-beta-L-altrosamine N-acetyltransferase n=1 Tax=Ketobacter alkanivorans TaxID=1917421 RepID=A0A2K9LN86_9GAMM|nr:UDP-4-amino-4,6-dideoxy-N-acetyl-beta-L-altrosamine N-acetyltransferase [Ketobacter alkanivorans]AUM13742.1 UDP-4-amino-4,6-dideoxy-N-acetyl-beta-L-altrosamine N-acetyltransferase [Ketobacter alkanivorans]
MTEWDLESVLAWRNHPEVRRFMFSRHEIELQEHKAWFEKASKQANRYLLVFEQDAQARGFVNLAVASGSIAEWGFYTDPSSPKGTGKALGNQLLSYAFGELKLHKLVGQVLAYNERSRNFHLRLGFQQEGILRQQHFDGEQYHDVYSYGMLASEWQQLQGENQ